ncbi:MAG TPA: hypothetical protein VJT15_05945 [Pyrinomonadaceae bacterium]|nr:hypothetical protein [Pyrinomonadaceae bacterium]
MSQSNIAEAEAYSIGRVVGRLLVSLVVILSALNLCVAQKVESVRSSQDLQCGEKWYQLRLLIAEAPIKDKLAESLAIVLTPFDESGSKVFGIYWIDAPDSSPTNRDNTTGAPSPTLLPYGNGKYNDVPVVQSFFTEAGCLPTDPQVTGIQTVIRDQGPPHNSYLRSVALKDLATVLSSQGVSVSANQVEQLSPQNSALFENLPDGIGFASAIHDYARKWSAKGGGGTEQPKNTEVEQLKTENAKSQARIVELEKEKGGFLSPTPVWLIIVLPFIAVLLLGGIVFFGLVIHVLIQRRLKKQNRLTKCLLALDNSGVSDPRTNGLGDGSATASAKLSTEITSGITDINGILKTLTTDVAVMKKSVVDFESKLNARPKGYDALQHIFTRLYESPHPRPQGDTLVKDVGQVVELFTWLRERSVFPDRSIHEAVAQLKRTVNELDTIRTNHFRDDKGKWPFLKDVAGQIESRFASDAERLEGFRSIQNEVRRLNTAGPNTIQVVTKLIDEHIEVQRKLEKYKYPPDLNKAFDAVVTDHQAVIDQVKRALPNQEGKIGELVTSLVDEYLKAKPEAERARELEAENLDLLTKLKQTDVELAAGKQLADEIAHEFNLKPDRAKGDEGITETLNRLKKERESSVYLQLRMGLSSALIALEKTIKRTGSDEDRNKVLEALHLYKVKDGIRKLLNQMEECAGEELWHRGLSEGFSEKWLHFLIRADLLLRTYYADHKEFAWLGKAVSLASSTILTALYEFQVEVVEVALLGERPKEMDTESVYSGLRNLPAVRDKVRLKIMNNQTEELVVDVTSFPYFVKGVQENRGRAALANPSAWRQH